MHTLSFPLLTRARVPGPRAPALTPAEVGSASHPLLPLVQELKALGNGLTALRDASAPTRQAWHRMLRQVKVHLFLASSQLMPVWRDMSKDALAVDCADLRLQRLAALNEEALLADDDDALAPARLAVLADELGAQLDREAALLRALESVVDPHSLYALADIWLSERQRIGTALCQGRSLAMDDENADPVGRPPR